jgi:hypothetical protein
MFLPAALQGHFDARLLQPHIFAKLCISFLYTIMEEKWQIGEARGQKALLSQRVIRLSYTSIMGAFKNNIIAIR